jgi:hypothetical protein
MFENPSSSDNVLDVALSLIEVAKLYDSSTVSSKYFFAIDREDQDAALLSGLSQVVNKNRPPCFKIRYISANAFGLSGNTHTSKATNNQVNTMVVEWKLLCMFKSPFSFLFYNSGGLMEERSATDYKFVVKCFSVFQV